VPNVASESEVHTIIQNQSQSTVTHNFFQPRATRCGLEATTDQINATAKLASKLQSIFSVFFLLYPSVQFSSDQYFNFVALAAWAAMNSLCHVIRSTEPHHFEFVSEPFSGQ